MTKSFKTGIWLVLAVVAGLALFAAVAMATDSGGARAPSGGQTVQGTTIATEFAAPTTPALNAASGGNGAQGSCCANGGAGATSSGTTPPGAAANGDEQAPAPQGGCGNGNGSGACGAAGGSGGCPMSGTTTDGSW